MDSQDRLLGWPEVRALTSGLISRRTIDRMEQRGEFPRRRRLSHKRIAWLESEVRAWLRRITATHIKATLEEPSCGKGTPSSSKR